MYFKANNNAQSAIWKYLQSLGGVCKLAVAESFPDDEGTYLCRAENEYGVAQCSAHVTVVTDGELECEHDNWVCIECRAGVRPFWLNVGKKTMLEKLKHRTTSDQENKFCNTIIVY